MLIQVLLLVPNTTAPLSRLSLYVYTGMADRDSEMKTVSIENDECILKSKLIGSGFRC